jgi:hypothetical protein
MWEEEENKWLFKFEEFIHLLLKLLSKHDMVMALPKGILTHQTVA